MEFQDILKAKRQHYGITEAAIEFAAEEFCHQKNSWISIVDKIPVIGQMVDAFHHPTGMRICNVVYDGTKFIEDPSCEKKTPCWKRFPTYWIGVTHWMPIIDLPTKKQP